MLDAFQQFIRNNDLCQKGNRILVAVSGGVDSAVMLDLFINSGYRVAIAHCNFKLRGVESNEDEKFVHALANKYHVAFYGKICDASTYASKNRCSIQEAARELRYAWFDEVCETNGFDFIAVGQHLDDQTETFFINLLRGAGVAGLKGMPLKRDKIIRPLLFARRNEIEIYAKHNNLLFREDSSNVSEKYVRNQIRHTLIPEIRKIKPDSETSILKSIENLYEDHLIFTQLLKEKREQIIRRNEDTWQIQIEDLKNLQPANTWAYYLLRDFGFNREVTDQIVSSLLTAHSGKLFYSETHHLLIDRDDLIIKPKQVNAEEEYFINREDTKKEKPVKLEINYLPVESTFHFKNDPSVAYFDSDKLTFPLKIRKWRQGDRFVPFGMSGSKLVSDYLIDLKISLFEKKRTFVITSGETIIWLIGHRVSNDFRITETTKDMLEIKIHDVL